MRADASRRKWAPAAILVASAVVRDVGLTACLLVMPATHGRGDIVGGTIAPTAIVFGVAAALLLALGTVLAFQSASRDEPRFVGWYTIALLALGLLGFVQTAFWWPLWPMETGKFGQLDAERVFNLIQALVAAHTAAVLIAATLRTFGSRIAPAWTASVSISLLISFSLATLAGIGWVVTGSTFVALLTCFPLGAALAIAWLVSVRREESYTPMHAAATHDG